MQRCAVSTWSSPGHSGRKPMMGAYDHRLLMPRLLMSRLVVSCTPASGKYRAEQIPYDLYVLIRLPIFLALTYHVDFIPDMINQGSLGTQTLGTGENIANPQSDYNTTRTEQTPRIPYDEMFSASSTPPNTSNDIYPITQLPAEVLVQIFSIIVDSSINLHRTELYNPFFNPANTITIVCSRWRAIALGAKLLWSYIDFRRVRNLEHANVLLDRTQGVPLDVIITPLRRSSQWPISLILHRLHYLNSINYCSNPDLAEHWLSEWRKNSTPASLRTLKLNLWIKSTLVFPSQSKEPPQERLDDLLSCVHTVFLRNIAVDWERVTFRGLVTLRLMGLVNRLPMGALIQILLASPALEHLQLCSLAIDLKSVPTPQPISLTQLHKLELSLFDREAMCLLCSTLIPGTRDLTIKMIPPNWNFPDPDSEFKESLFTLFRRANIKAFYLCGSGLLNCIITATPNLEILVISDAEIHSDICNAIAPPPKDNIEPLPGLVDTPWSKLHTFHATKCSFSDIHGFKRVLSTCPIRKLKISEHRSPPGGVWNWAGPEVEFSTKCPDWTTESLPLYDEDD